MVAPQGNPWTEGSAMPMHHHTNEPFTVAICSHCSTEMTAAVAVRLREVIRRCPHAMLIATRCILGEFTCATNTAERGPMILLQPCTLSRAPSASAIWVGPILTDTDATLVARWIATGHWNITALPLPLRANTMLVRSGHRN